jgi:hypothetical protein
MRKDVVIQVLLLALTCSCASFLGCNTLSKKGVLSPAPDAITAPPSPKEICGSDAGLLTTYHVDELFGTPLPLRCCTPGVLAEDRNWLCEHDWPSSDVPLCSHWAEMAQELAHLRTNPPAWYSGEHDRLAEQNMNLLLSYSEGTYRCFPDEPSP